MSLSESPQKRDVSLDVIKGFLIALVVYVHCLEVGNGGAYQSSRVYMDYPVYKFIYGFFMPSFMLISGYLFGRRLDRTDGKGMLPQLLWSYLLPVFCWSLLGFGWHVAFGGYKWLSLTRLAFDYYYFSITFVWYFTAILFAALITIAARRLGRFGIVIALAVIPLLFIIPDTVIIPQVKYLYVYFIAGYYGRNHFVFAKKPKLPRYAVTAVCLAVYLILLRLWSIETYIYNGGFAVKNGQLAAVVVNNSIRWAAGFAGSGFVISLVRWILSFEKIKDANITSSVASLGQQSLYVYIISSLVLTPILAKLTRGFGFRHITAVWETVIVLAVSIAGAWFSKRVRVVNLLFFGRKGKP